MEQGLFMFDYNSCTSECDVINPSKSRLTLHVRVARPGQARVTNIIRPYTYECPEYRCTDVLPTSWQFRSCSTTINMKQSKN